MQATIGLTKQGTYGILWAEFPYMESRGGYSGPFNTREEAVLRAKEIARLVSPEEACAIVSVTHIE